MRHFRTTTSMKKTWAPAALLPAALLLVPAGGVLSGCYATKKVAQKATEVAADALIPVSQENELGAQFSKEVEAEAKLHPDKDVQDYIKGLGNAIVRAAKARGEVPDGIKFTFKVIDDDNTVNAFALPGGYIYFYTGLLKMADNEAEVIGVMGHEVAHVTERHIAQRLVQTYGLQAVVAMAGGENADLLTQLATNVAAQGLILKYSRDHERDADTHGLPLVIDAGYDPNGFVSFFEKLKAMGGPNNDLLVILQSHPHPEERLESAKRYISIQPNLPTKTNKDRLDAIKAKM